MIRNIIVSTFVIMLLSIGVVHAECHLDGHVYEENEVVGGYICKGGNWEEL